MAVWKIRSKRFPAIEYVMTGAALLVSVISLVVAIGTESANKKLVDANYKMVAAASWPSLQIDSGNGDEAGHDAIELSLENAGVGPAKFETFEMFWNGRPFATSTALMSACCAGMQKRPWTTATHRLAGIVLRPGSTRRFLRFDRKPDNEQMWQAFDRVRLSQLSYRACYCSVFDECWVSNLNGFRARRVNECPVVAVPYRE